MILKDYCNCWYVYMICSREKILLATSFLCDYPFPHVLKGENLGMSSCYIPSSEDVAEYQPT